MNVIVCSVLCAAFSGRDSVQEERAGGVGRARIFCAILCDGCHSSTSESRHSQSASSKDHFPA